MNFNGDEDMLEQGVGRPSPISPISVSSEVPLNSSSFASSRRESPLEPRPSRHAHLASLNGSMRSSTTSSDDGLSSRPPSPARCRSNSLPLVQPPQSPSSASKSLANRRCRLNRNTVDMTTLFRSKLVRENCKRFHRSAPDLKAAPMSKRPSFRMRQSDFRKKQKVQRTFLQLSQLIVLVGIGTMIYFDVLMVLPHLTAIFWAIVWAVLLAKPREVLLNLHHRIGAWGGVYRIRFMTTAIVIYATTLSFAGLFSAIMSTISFAIFVFMLYGNRHTVVASVLLVAVLVFIAIPTGILLKSSVEEMDEMIRRATDFIAKNPEVQQIFDDFGSSSLYLWCGKYVKSWGYEMPQWDADQFKEQAVNALSWVGNNVVVLYSASVNVVSTTGRFMMSFVTFLTFLFYLLKQPGQSLFSFMDGLSPFSEQDTIRLLDSAKRSLSRACVCSLLIGALHMAVTFVTCRICGLEFTTILSVLSGLLSMLPVISSWIVWVPVSMGLYFSGHRFYGFALALTHIMVELYVDTLILSFIPGNAYFVGLAVVTGCYVFGPGGVLAGPLLAGFSATVLDIYRDYVSQDLVSIDPNTPEGQSSHTKNRSQSLLDLETWLGNLLGTPVVSPNSTVSSRHM